MLSSALDAARRGLGVLPAVAGSKRPAGRYGGRAALRTEAEIRRHDWSGGVCVMLGSGIYVLDADTPETVPLVEQFDTLRVRTARGMHAYFTLPAGVWLRQGAGATAIKGLDGKGRAATGTHTVALWASADGRHVCHDVPLRPLPAEWVERIGPATRAGSGAYLTPPEAAALDAAYAASTPEHRAAGERHYAAAVLRLVQDWRSGTRSWGDHAYFCAVRVGELVAHGWVDHREALVDLWSVFELEDTWPEGDATGNVRRSFARGLAVGVRESL